MDHPTAKTSKSNFPVYIVDDEATMRRSLATLMHSAGIHATSFSSAAEFLEHMADLNPGCVLLDLYMPDITGQELQGRLAREGFDWPVIVITGHGDISTAVSSMKQGAFDFIEKPFDPNTLLQRIEDSRLYYLDSRATTTEAAMAAERVGELTDRELEVLDGFVAGLRNKQVGAALNISTRTVEFHRKNIFQKLHARSVSDAVRLAVLAGRARNRNP
jgi:two-component system, LuxR family, response regulator FixJ